MTTIGDTIRASTVHLLLRHGLVLRKFLELLELSDEVLELHELRVIMGDVVIFQMLISLSVMSDVALDDKKMTMRQGAWNNGYSVGSDAGYLLATFP